MINIWIFYPPKTAKSGKNLTDPKEMAKLYGVLAKKIHQRLQDLRAASHLGIMKTLPAARCHELTGNLKGELAVDISGNFRILFEPLHNPTPKKEDGGLNWEKVSKIQINAIEDYH